MGETVSRALAPCPVYANKGCFTSISRHLEDGVQVDGKTKIIVDLRRVKIQDHLLIIFIIYLY